MPWFSGMWQFADPYVISEGHVAPCDRGFNMFKLRTPFLAAALFTGVAAVGLTPAFAQTAPGPVNSTAAPSEARHHAMERMMPGQLVDGRIAFFKAELKITPAQETQWQQVETAMRENANALDPVINTAREQRGTMDAVQRLTM